MLGGMTPKVVYHYTDANALLCILKDCAIRATDFRHLNDTQEIKYGWSEFLETLGHGRDEPSEFSDAYAAQLLSINDAGAENLESLGDSVFVACFSERPDDLNQWRSYADDGRGVALGFDLEKISMVKVPYYYHTPAGLAPVIAENTKEQIEWGSFLQKVSYGHVAREKAISHALWKIEQHCGPNSENSFETKVANSIGLISHTLSDLALIKDAGFESEREWRLTIREHFGYASAPIMSAFSKLGIEPFARGPLMTLKVEFAKGGPGGIKPHTSLGFDKSALVEVVVGPNLLDKPLGSATLTRVLLHHGFLDTKVGVSRLSYRH
jgi:Protein of unknown function (DUF2971)